MAKIDTKELFDRGRTLINERQENFDQARAVRETLRNLRDAGMLSESEEAELEELFPARRSGEGEDENGDI